MMDSQAGLDLETSGSRGDYNKELSPGDTIRDRPQHGEIQSYVDRPSSVVRRPSSAIQQGDPQENST
jgi:hypothetical protein